MKQSILVLLSILFKSEYNCKPTFPHPASIPKMYLCYESGTIFIHVF